MRSFCFPIAIGLAGLLTTAGADWVTGAKDTWAYDGDAVPRANAIQRISEQRLRYVNDLRSGRMSLQQTAKRFHRLSKEVPACSLDWLWIVFPDASSENELHFRHVLLYVEVSARGAHSELTAIIQHEVEVRTMTNNWSFDDSPSW